MSDYRYEFERVDGFDRPLIFRVGWPEPVGFSEGAIRAVLFDSSVNKKDFLHRDALVVNRDEKFLQLESIDSAVRVTSGDYVGEGSRVASVVVRLDDFGSPIPPKRGIRRLLTGGNDIHCSWQEALAISLNFVGSGPMPPNVAWWHGGGE